MKSQNNPQNYMLGWASAIKAQDRRGKEQKGRILAFIICLHTRHCARIYVGTISPLPLKHYGRKQ